MDAANKLAQCVVVMAVMVGVDVANKLARGAAVVVAVMVGVVVGFLVPSSAWIRG